MSVMHHVIHDITRLVLLCPCAASQNACDIAHRSNAVYRWTDGHDVFACQLAEGGVEMQVWYALLRWEGDRWRPRFSYQPETLQVGIPTRI